MALRPARMVRLAIVAPHPRQRAIIEALHAARILHLEEYTEGMHPELKLGQPLAESSKASERLVRVRALVRQLGPADTEPTALVPGHQLAGRMDETIDDLERRIGAAVERRDQIARDLEARIEERGALAPLTDLGLDLADLAGYDALRVFLGKAEPDMTATARGASPGALVVRGADAQVIFAPKTHADRVAEALTAAGFKELEAPRGQGLVPERVSRLEGEVRDLEKQLVQARADLEGLRADHGTWLLAAEEDLSIEVEKSEAPLSFGHSERAFVVDAWVPEASEADVRARVEAAAQGAVHIEVLDRGLRAEHHRSAEPPTEYAHPKPVRPFGFFLDLFARPMYGEIDPTLVLSLVFPFFFGFMIGDLGYGVLLSALGFLLFRRIGKKSETARGLGFAMLVAGVWAAFFGGIVFHDAFGVPFVAHEEGELAWFAVEPDAGGHAVASVDLLGITVSEHSRLAHPILEKLGDTDIKSMLVLSVIAGFVHLTLGFLFAIINHWSHSKRHVAAQFAWLAVLTGFFVLVVVMADQGAHSPVSGWLMGVMGQPQLVTHSLPLIAVGFVALLLTEGAMGAVEVLSLLSHIISYTRLAGIAVAKGGMAMGFNGLFLRDMAIGGDGILIVVGVVMFFVAQLVLFILGILSSGIQAIRLNYVEFFLKFYKGGGRPYTPFGRVRARSSPSVPTTTT